MDSAVVCDCSNYPGTFVVLCKFQGVFSFFYFSAQAGCLKFLVYLSRMFSFTLFSTHNSLIVSAHCQFLCHLEPGCLATYCAQCCECALKSDWWWASGFVRQGGLRNCHWLRWTHRLHRQTLSSVFFWWCVCMLWYVCVCTCIVCMFTYICVVCTFMCCMYYLC